MAPAPDPDPAPAPTAPSTRANQTLRVRRAPRYGVFFALGAALGVLAAVILTFAFDGSEEASMHTGVTYSATQVFGFVALACVPVGLAIGGVVALVLDRTLARRTRQVQVAHEHLPPTR